MMKYTLDRIIDDNYVFLEWPDEVNELVIKGSDINVKLSEGDIVEIHTMSDTYKIKVLEAETEDMHTKVSILLEKLKNKK